MASNGQQPDGFTETLLSHIDQDSRRTIFEHFWKKFEVDKGHIDLGALEGCVRLLPAYREHDPLWEDVQRVILSKIPQHSLYPDHLYRLAQVCVGNIQLATCVFGGVLQYLKDIRPTLQNNRSDSSLEETFPFIIPYLNFLKASYWLPSDRPHFITDAVVQALVDLLGYDLLDRYVHDTLSALIGLLRSPVSIISSPASLVPTPDLGEREQAGKSLIGEQLWDRLKNLPSTYFEQGSRCFRTWYQWCNHAVLENTELLAIHDPLYWSRLSDGLGSGFSEQRRYCLGILRLSMILARRDIETSVMVLRIDQRSRFLAEYDTFSSLFETIVLDRYPNQVQTCLKELTNLLGPGSFIHPHWTTILLSSALHPKVQDGVRKIIGNWYIDFIIKNGSMVGHERFLISGFLPWATQGSLFTNSLVSFRSSTTCTHGDAVADVISRAISAMPTGQDRSNLFTSILRFILDRRGRLFQHSILYILKGLERAFRDSPDYCVDIDQDGLELVAQVSRLPGLPEVASDLNFAYCGILVQQISRSTPSMTVIGVEDMAIKLRSFQTPEGSTVATTAPIHTYQFRNVTTLEQFLGILEASSYKAIQGNLFIAACDDLVHIFNSNTCDSHAYTTLFKILEALWDEAERQEFRRPIAVAVPRVFFHPFPVRMCKEPSDVLNNDPLSNLLKQAMDQMRQLSVGRTYLLPVLTSSLRRIGFINDHTISRLPFEEFLFHFIMDPPLPKKEFLFEVAAADMLQSLFPHRSYESYYGKREWYAYACVIDLLSRFPTSQMDVAKRVMKRLIQPWKDQKRPVPIISKWKNLFQLQCMLIMVDNCVSETDAPWYLESFLGALTVEPWPRYRLLLEWIVARIFYRFPTLSSRIMSDLTTLDDAVPIHTASLIKVATLVCHFLDSEKYALQLSSQLIAFSANPKIHIRHEAQWIFPFIWDLAEQKRWTSIVESPAFAALNNYIRQLEKYNNPPPGLRTLVFNVVENHTIVEIFQGRYLTLETPAQQFVSYEDFIDLWEEDLRTGLDVPQSTIEVGISNGTSNIPEMLPAIIEKAADMRLESDPAPLQTKSGFDFASLLSMTETPSILQSRPTSVVLVASLIDNPTNLGGLSRISESFGLEALHINDLKQTATKDFQSTAVTSHKHLPIHELKIAAVPEYLTSMKRKGYEVVAIEQTDRSGILGDDDPLQGEDVDINQNKKALGSLPRNCVLVLGSEKGGVSAEVLAAVDRCVEIRTVGVTRSLNVQTAAGIAVFEWWREWGKKL